MAREFLAMFHGGDQEEVIWYNSGTLVLLGIVFLSLLLISMIIFSCGLDENDPYPRRAPPPVHRSSRYSSRYGGSATHPRKPDRRLSGLGGDGGGGGGDGGGG
ncbi:hypothetical protein LR48_Vigan05g139800 [Vigna angularis]|uniref:Uncharacterized protein n=2 Tax=Phaseolus angularis TaxID=3914 RepID=A0A0L9UM10_PHAAN|nr:hypothetical protein LR48_Vigan05g139800 [Vigna angularis]BAT92364.1 hypothetical protein VIGAN_07106400 [Vigna angularis var. angularis]